MAVLATYNVKGGVGKTATVVNLAHRAVLGADGDTGRALVFDLDPQGAASYYFRAAPKARQGGKSLVRGKVDVREAITPTDFAGIDLIPSDFSFRNLDVVLDAAKDPGHSLARVVRPLTKRYEHVHNYDDLPAITLQQIEHFFAHYKDLEPGKWVKVLGWGDAAQAQALILEGIERAKKAKAAA